MPAPQVQHEPESITPAIPNGETDLDVEGESIGVEEAIEPDSGRLPFPPVSPTRPEADVLPPQAIKQDPLEKDSADVGKKKKTRGWELLPEIARLAKEMVKNGEEKVAVAQGAYNSASRHPLPNGP
jgi:hypothetical protein